MMTKKIKHPLADANLIQIEKKCVKMTKNDYNMTTKDTKPPEKQSVNIKSDKMRKGKISTKHQKKPQITLKMAKLHEMDKKGLQKEKKTT